MAFKGAITKSGISVENFQIDKSCQIIRMPKGRSKFRLIYIPNPEYMKQLRKLLPGLLDILMSLDGQRADYAFSPRRNSVLNAFQHIGYRYTLSFDLKDFFDSITVDHVSDLISADVVDFCFVDGAPRQGLPTSPVISSIAFASCDREIQDLLSKFGLDAIYTRYADDLVFSFNRKSDAGKINTLVRHVLVDHNFILNERKTSLQDSLNGRVIITGIAVDARGLHPTRRTLKKIRAAKHQNNISSVRGLEEWAKCKFPKAIGS